MRQKKAMARGAPPEDGGLRDDGRSRNGTLSLACEITSYTSQHGSQLLCCMTRDVVGNRWQVQALYD